MSDFSDADVQEFVIEASELLDAAEAELLAAEKGQSASFYDAAFRAFHSIKGGAGMLSLPELQNHMHKLESMWVKLKGKTALQKSESEFFLSAIDHARKLMRGEQIAFDYNSPLTTSEPSAPNVAPPPTNTTPIPQPAPTIAIPTTQKPDSTKGRGLVYAVDDEPEILEIIKDILEDESFEVMCFGDPNALIQALQSRGPDVVITDFKMPKKSGLEVLHEVRAAHPDTPVIMASGFLSKEILIESMQDGGFYGALEKPFKHTDLLREVLSAYRHHEVRKMMRKSLNLLVYQFSDLEKFLISQGQGDVAKTLGRDLKELLAKQKELYKR